MEPWGTPLVTHPVLEVKGPKLSTTFPQVGCIPLTSDSAFETNT